MNDSHQAVPNPNTGAVDPFVSRTIIQHLNKVLESPAFRGSDRCKHFLDFVVRQAVEGKAEELKERVIGSQVFGRPGGYETAGDAIVRVKANEVRKRLAQYYADSANRNPVQIELPAGSYIPRFDWHLNGGDRTAPPNEVSSGTHAAIARSRFNRWLIGVALAAAVATISLWLLWPGRPSELDQFWGPALNGSGVPVIFLGSAEAYMVSDRLKEQIQNIRTRSDQATTILATPGDIIHLSGFYLSMGNFYTVSRISALLQARGKSPEFRSGPEVKLDDMRGRPVIFIGAYMNLWTLQSNAKLRFQFQGEPGSQGVKSIRDNMNPGRTWTLDKVFPWGPQPVDYAIVSRVWDPTSDSVAITAAGINTFGTQVAGEFLTTPSYWKDLSRRLPAGWQRKNLQVVLETSVVGTTPSPPKVVASYVW